MEAQVPVFKTPRNRVVQLYPQEQGGPVIPPGTGWSSYPPRNRVVQLYPQALGSLFVAFCDSQVYGGGIRTRLQAGKLTHLRVRVTWRLAVYRQSVRLSAKSLDDHDQRFFFSVERCDHSPHVTSSLTRR
jgi:hypothetical protein